MKPFHSRQSTTINHKKMSIEIQNGITRHPAWRMAEPVNLNIANGEQVAIIGDNAAGKSRLVEILIQHFPLLMNEVKYDFGDSQLKFVSENLKYISFRDSYGEQDSTYYYQQRWNQHDIDESMPTVGQLLQDSFQKADASIGQNLPEDQRLEAQRHRDNLREKLVEMFNLGQMMDKYIITLSSGEMRKFQLTRTLGMGPRIVIMDNPFIGLDAETRDQLRDLLCLLARETELQVILVVNRAEDVPSFITHVIPIEDIIVKEKQESSSYIKAKENEKLQIPEDLEQRKQMVMQLPERNLDGESFYPSKGGEILKFNGVSIRYGSRTILSNLDWTVHEGEFWAVKGRNGSGKSTLLSLVCADNPQAYACDIELFGHRRGSGESIWEIKKHIGYVSPEMHRAYQKDIPSIDIVASGLNDTVGLYTRPKPEQMDICRTWMRIFGIEHLAERTFLKLSSGEQRLCLLARAFVKDPELLILDEPLHGLDARNRYVVKEIINTFCQRKHKTLVMVTHYENELPPCIDMKLELKRN